MNIEEQLKKLTEQNEQVTKENGELKEHLEKLEKNQKEQNKYITELEAKAKNAQQPQQETQTQKPQTPVGFSDDHPFVKNMRVQWQERVIGDAFKKIRESYPEEHVEAMRTEVEDYAKERMTDNNTTTQYVKSVFELLYGRALGNKNHKIHKVSKPEDPKPEEDPQQKPEPQTQPPRKPANADTFTPHTMTSKDNPPSPGNTNEPSQPTYKSTKESHSALKSRLDNSLLDS